MRRSVITILIFLSYISCQKSNLSDEKKIDIKSNTIDKKEFSIKDTSSINKIIITGMNEVKISLKRANNKWILNDKYNANQRKINELLKVIKHVRVKRSVPKSSKKMAIQNLATSSLKIDISTNNEINKTYFVGTKATSNSIGTYMQFKGSDPYVTHIPGFHGYLTPKYGDADANLNEDDWKEQIIIRINDIDKIIINDVINRNQSFTINNIDKKVTNNNKIIVSEDSNKINEFCNYFIKLQCGEIKSNKKASDYKLIKKMFIYNKNTIDSLFIYETTKDQKSLREFNTNVKIKYVIYNNSDLVSIQDRIFNKVLITLDEFIK